MDWNPTVPILLGNEWRPAQPASPPVSRVAAPADAVVQRLDSTATETIDQIAVYAASDTDNGSMLVETLLAGQEVPAVTTTIVRPNGSASVSGWTSTSGTFENAINQAAFDSASFVTADNTLSSGDKHFSLEFATGALFAGERIVGLRLKMVIATNSPSHTRPMRLSVTAAAKAWATDQQFAAGDVFGPTTVTQTIDTGEIDRVTLAPWTVAAVQAMDGSGYRVAFGDVFFDNVSGTNLYAYYIYQVWLEVDHCPENRLTRDIVAPGVAGARWTAFTPHKPDGTANLAKVNGTDLTAVVRQARYGNIARPSPVSADYTLSIPYLNGSNATPPPGLIDYNAATLDPTGAVVALGTASLTRAVGVDLRVSGTGSVDSQTYIRVEPIDLAAGGPAVQQDIANAAATLYAGVIVVAKVDGSDDGGQLDLLTVALRKRSDNSVVATASIDRGTALTFPPATGDWRTLQIPFAVFATLAPATTYYLDVTQNRAEAGAFTLAGFTSQSGGAETQPGGLAGYGGQTLKATYLGGTHASAADLAAVAFQAYTTPTGIDATADVLPIPGAVDCGPDGIPYIEVTWDPFVSATRFGWYELQRLDNFSDWQSIGRLSTYTRGQFFDFEARLGILSCYRLRAVSAEGLGSAWTDTVCGTAPVAGCGYSFTSNVLNNAGTGLMAAYADTPASSGLAERPVTFPEADEVKRQAIYGRPNYISFIPTERRGDEFTRRLYLDGLVAPTLPPPGDAGALRDLSRAPIPYVCVRDEHGGRWFANVRIPDYSQRNPGEFQHVTAAIGERMAVPSNELTP